MRTPRIHKPDTPEIAPMCGNHNLAATAPFVCETARFLPFGFRINARPARAEIHQSWPTADTGRELFPCSDTSLTTQAK
ncbi:MAG TPA: hypothetical protein VFZ59_05735 [Verrucomicrobiae bacterium]|nr:hypothetical protein [Verrucomicrobiae bacterium]